MDDADIVRALVVHDGDLLVVRNGPDDDSHPGCWEIVGGWVEDGESLEDAVRREVIEETGLTPRGMTQRGRVDVAEPGEEVLTCRFYRVLVDGRGVTLSGEHDAHRWIDPMEYRGLKHHYYSAFAIPVVERLGGGL